MLRSLLHEKIKKSPHGRIPFSEFMSLCLYHPTWGYYERRDRKIGKEGDFFTNSSVGSVYGEIWADRWINDWNLLFLRPEDPHILVEIGGGDGRFAEQVLNRIKSSSPHVYDRLLLLFVEGSSYHREMAAERLREHERHLLLVKGVDELPEWLAENPALVYSNELFDALPVERVKRMGNELLECWITWSEEGRLQEIWIPLENQSIANYLTEMNIILPRGHEMEIPLVMREVYWAILRSFQRGILYTVDYGYLFEEVLHPLHRKGTLMGYRQHRHMDHFYDAPGEMDITSHVQFEALIRWGETSGLKTFSFLTQREWLLQNGILERLVAHQDRDPFSPHARRNRAITQLILPGGMGDTFRILVQGKGVNLTQEKWNEDE